MPLQPGTTLGPYEVTAKIGEGGMGEVYRATDTSLDRQVAIKVLPDAFASDAERLARFEREAKVLASLNHPNIGAIYGLEKSGDTRALVLELVEGPTLAERIKQGPIPVDEALSIAKQIAEALEAAHEQGIIHRDLKPANVKVKDDGTVKVLDFGLAKAFQPDASDPNLSQSPTISLTAAATQMGMVIGTAAYMAPEQAKGLTVDKRADIWAYGAVLFEMLTGRKLFEAGDVSEMLASVLVKDPDVSSIEDDVPAHVRSVVRQCLVKDPKERLRDIGDVRLAMTGVFDPTVSTSAEPTGTPQLQVWQRPVPAAIAALLVLALAVLVGWILRPNEQREVSRFAYELPASHQLRATFRAVLAVSPDGRQFVYNTTQGLYLRSMDALEARLLPGTEESLANPVFSPDGQALAYFTRVQELKRLALSGGAPVVIADEIDPASGMSWGTDGAILFGQRQGIMRVPATGGRPELVIPAAQGELLDSPRLLPDGDSVLMSVGAGASGEASVWNDANIVIHSLTTGERAAPSLGGLLGGSNTRFVSIREDDDVPHGLRQLECAETRCGEGRPGRVPGHLHHGEAGFDPLADHQQFAGLGQADTGSAARAQHHLLRLHRGLPFTVRVQERPVNSGGAIRPPAYPCHHRGPPPTRWMTERRVEPHSRRDRDLDTARAQIRIDHRIRSCLRRLPDTQRRFGSTLAVACGLTCHDKLSVVVG